MSKKKITATTENPRYAREIQELRRSGAAGIHGDRRTKRKRTRSAVRTHEIATYDELSRQGEFFLRRFQERG